MIGGIVINSIIINTIMTIIFISIIKHFHSLTVPNALSLEKKICFKIVQKKPSRAHKNIPYKIIVTKKKIFFVQNILQQFFFYHTQQRNSGILSRYMIIKGPDKNTSQLLPIISLNGFSGVWEGRKDKGGGERSRR
jgi:hypothetical protein